MISLIAGNTFNNWQSDVICSVGTLAHRRVVDEFDENIQHQCRLHTRRPNFDRVNIGHATGGVSPAAASATTLPALPVRVSGTDASTTRRPLASCLTSRQMTPARLGKHVVAIWGQTQVTSSLVTGLDQKRVTSGCPRNVRRGR